MESDPKPANDSQIQHRTIVELLVEMLSVRIYSTEEVREWAETYSVKIETVFSKGVLDQVVEYCEVTEDVPVFAQKDYYGLWCTTHGLYASHCGPDGDTRVCVEFAKQHGCNCCPEDRKKT